MIGKIKCELCSNFVSNSSNPSEWKCKAFPNGIPENKIAYIDYDDCINCNNGIGFELNDDND